MPLDNNQIADHARTIVGATIKLNPKITDEGRVVIAAAEALVVNLLQNINDLAAKARGEF